MNRKIDLSGQWKVWLGDEMTGPAAMITLPGTTAEAKLGRRSEERAEGYLTEYYHYEGCAWFEREFSLPERSGGCSWQLRLERTRLSQVWLDGQYVGSRDSLTTGHWYDLTEYLAGRGGVHRLTVAVRNVGYSAPGGHMTSQDTQTNWNGIVGEIALYRYGTVRIAASQVTASAERREVGLSLRLECYGESRIVELAAECGTETGKSCMEMKTVRLSRGENSVEMTLKLPDDFAVIPWNEFTPQLYRLQITVRETVEAAAPVSDSLTMRIGFRDLHTTPDSFYLNDLPVFLRGKHEALTFPLTGYAPMDREAWLKVFTTAKAYGINHYRFHTCCPPEAAFEAADELGMYLEPELPFWGTVAAEGEPEYDKTRQDYLYREGLRMLREFGNHPSFLLFSLGNELWGSPEELNRILGEYKAADGRHWYTQGSNNFQFTPVILENEDFFCGVRFSRERLFRGSYAMCDAPQGHVQLTEPENEYDYDAVIRPDPAAAEENASEPHSGTVEIQFGTGTKTVRAESAGENVLIPRIPVVSHEIGQYAVYPDYREIEKYTGVVGAENLKIFKQRLEEKGMGHMARRFFLASGKLSAQCYKRELETAWRSRRLAGFQLLDLEDFPGQGSAFVGMLNAFMESKGLIEPEKWRQFCGDRVLMLAFPRYVYRSGETFDFRVLLYNGNPAALPGGGLILRVKSKTDQADICEERIPAVMPGLTRLTALYEGKIRLPEPEKPQIYQVSAEIAETDVRCEYDIYVFPETAGEDAPAEAGRPVITSDRERMLSALDMGERVWYLGGRLREDKRIAADYCTDFWNYPMFRSISDSMGRPRPIGTLGMYIQNEHPALADFPAEEYTTPPWWKLLHGAYAAVLDGTAVEPVVWMIDNVERNHRLGMIYEARVGKGRLLVCQSPLAGGSPEEKWMYRSLLEYISQETWQPQAELTPEQLRGIYEG